MAITSSALHLQTGFSSRHLQILATMCCISSSTSVSARRRARHTRPVGSTTRTDSSSGHPPVLRRNLPQSLSSLARSPQMCLANRSFMELCMAKVFDAFLRSGARCTVCLFYGSHLRARPIGLLKFVRRTRLMCRGLQVPVGRRSRQCFSTALMPRTSPRTLGSSTSRT